MAVFFLMVGVVFQGVLKLGVELGVERPFLDTLQILVDIKGKVVQDQVGARLILRLHGFEGEHIYDSRHDQKRQGNGQDHEQENLVIHMPHTGKLHVRFS